MYGHNAGGQERENDHKQILMTILKQPVVRPKLFNFTELGMRQKATTKLRGKCVASTQEDIEL